MAGLTGADLRTRSALSGRDLQYAEPTPEQRGFLAPLMIPRGSSVPELAFPQILYGPFDAARRILSGEYDREEVGKLALEVGGVAAPGALVTRPAGALASGLARPARQLAEDAASRLARARERGFNTDERLFHGTYRDFDRFSLKRGLRNTDDAGEAAVWLTPDPEVATNFGQYFAGSAKSDSGAVYRRGVRTMPLYARGKEKVIDREYLAREHGDEFARRQAADPEYVSPIEGEGYILYDPEVFGAELKKARAEGYDSVRFAKVEEGMGAPADQVAVFSPKNVRSTQAMFDPARRRSGNLLSSDPLAAWPSALADQSDWER